MTEAGPQDLSCKSIAWPKELPGGKFLSTAAGDMVCSSVGIWGEIQRKGVLA